jgi:hypothetical protein
MGTVNLLEKDVQARVVARLEPTGILWRSIAFTNYTTAPETLEGLIGNRAFAFTQQPALIRHSSGLSVDLFGGQKPDIVIHSQTSKQNRIIIEVKKNAVFTHREPHGSQILRYFLHLLATTDQKPNGRRDIDRAVLLAAPSSWFEEDSRSALWKQFVNDYGPLAKTFQIALGEIRTDDLEKDGACSVGR